MTTTAKCKHCGMTIEFSAGWQIWEVSGTANIYCISNPNMMSYEKFHEPYKKEDLFDIIYKRMM